MEENQINLLIFGPPGSGKGTQSRLIAENIPGLVVISTGDLLRAEVFAGTEVGREIAAVIKEGKLVDDSLVCEMMLRKLRRIQGGFLLDGFPRNLKQAEFLTVVMNLLGRKIDVVLKLEVTADVVESRLIQRLVCKMCGSVTSATTHENKCAKCGGSDYIRRDDDEAMVIKRRLQEYEREVTVLEKYYQDRVVRIDGNKSVEDVYDDIKHGLSRVNN